MAFPGSYDFTYYKGDTLEFRVYPKDASGAAFSLAEYSVEFTIAKQRGVTAPEDRATGFAQINGDESYILCAITPDLGNRTDFLVANTKYVYDVQITKLDDPLTVVDGQAYDYVYTLLTGEITVRDQVTGAVADLVS